MSKEGFFSYGKLIALTDKWGPVVEFFGTEHIQWLMFFVLSPIWLLVKVFVTFGFWIHRQVEHWPWFFIQFFIFELVIVTMDVGADTVQGFRLIRNGDEFWGGFTLSFVALPMVSSFIIHSFKKCKAKDKDNEMKGDKIYSYKKNWRYPLIKLRYTIKSSDFAWVMQFPLFQQLAYFAILFELYEIDKEEKDTKKENSKLVKNFVDIEPSKSDKKSNEKRTMLFAKQFNKLNEKKIKVMHDFLHMKLFEAFLEAAPQAVLQMMIVLRRGFSGPMDVFTILTSILSLTMCSTKLFWKYPTQNCELREDTASAEVGIIFPWMSIIVFTKVIFAATMFAIFPVLGFAIIITTALIRLTITKVFWRNMPLENNFLGAMTSITAPCLLVEENSKYYPVTNIISESLSMMFVCTIYLISRLDILSHFQSSLSNESAYLNNTQIVQCNNTSDDPLYLLKKSILQCDTQELNVTQISRCTNASDPDSCVGLFPGPIHGTCGSVTACPEGSNNWLPLLYMCIILLIFQVLSILSTLIMSYLSDKMHRFKVSLKLNDYSCSMFPVLWKEKDQDWQDEAKAYLDGTPQDTERLLKSAISSGGHLSLVQELVCKPKVHISEDIYHLACQQSDLGVIKILVEYAKEQPRMSPGVEIEEGFLPEPNLLKESLFGDKNEFIHECLNNKAALGAYMKQVYKDLFGQEYESKDIDNAKVSPFLDASKISTNISVFELQNQDKELINQHLLMNIHLNWTKNVKMLVMSNKTHFECSKSLKQAMIAAAQTSNLEVLKFLTCQFSEVTFEQGEFKEIFEVAVLASNDNFLDLLMKGYNKSLSDLDEGFVKKLFATANQANANSLTKEFSFLLDKDFLMKSMQTAIMNGELGVISQLYDNIPGSEELEEQYVSELLKSSIEKSFPEAIDLLMKLYSSTIHLKEAHVNEFFQESMKQPGIDVLECLLKQFAHQIANEKAFILTQTENAIRYGDSDSLSFFIQNYAYVQNGSHGKFADANPDLLMSAIEKLPNPLSGSDIVEAAWRVFRDKSEAENFEHCKLILEKVPGAFRYSMVQTNWLLLQVVEKSLQNPEEYMSLDFWTYFHVAGFKNAASQQDDDKMLAILKLFPKVQQYQGLFKEMDFSAKSRVLQQYPTWFQKKIFLSDVVEIFNDALQRQNDEIGCKLLEDYPLLPIDESKFEEILISRKLRFFKSFPKKFQYEVLKNDFVEAFEEMVKEKDMKDIEFFLDEFPDFLHKCNLAIVSSLLDMLPSRFGCQSIDKTLIQSMKESDIACVSSYLNTIKSLQNNLLTKRMWTYCLQNSNINLIYFLLENIKTLKNSYDDLNRCLRIIDLRVNDIDVEEIDKTLEENIHRDSQFFLYASVKIGAFELVKTLIQKGCSVETKTVEGKTPLHIAVIEGQLECVKLLLQNEASVDPQDHFKRRPLFYAAEYGLPEIVQALLNRGANKKLMSMGFSSQLEITALDVATMKLRQEEKKKSHEKSQKKIQDYEEVINLLK